jgi:hypothetical protein
MRFKCQKVEQITVFLQNRPGILADLCAHLADHEVNLRAMTTLESTDVGSVRLVVDDPERARRVFDEAGVGHATSECLALEMPNHPGGFADIAHKLALAGINIDFIYASTSPDATSALGVFGVSDLDRALALDW